MTTTLLINNITYIYVMLFSFYYLNLVIYFFTNFVLKVEQTLNLSKSDIAYFSVYMGMVATLIQKV